MTEDNPNQVELSEEDLERAVRAGLDARAAANELFSQFARPDERVQMGHRIDPATARVFFLYAKTMDPYGDDPDLPEEMQQVGREYFAVDPANGIAVALFDLPDETRDALEEKRPRQSVKAGGGYLKSSNSAALPNCQLAAVDARCSRRHACTRHRDEQNRAVTCAGMNASPHSGHSRGSVSTTRRAIRCAVSVRSHPAHNVPARSHAPRRAPQRAQV